VLDGHLAQNDVASALTDVNNERGSDASREEPTLPPPMPGTTATSVVLVADVAFAGLGSLYVTTNSIAVTVVAAALISLLSVVMAWARTRHHQ
jgi:hypothetical protein